MNLYLRSIRFRGTNRGFSRAVESLQVVTKTNGAIKLTWSTVSDQMYQLQFRTNLVQTNWINLGGVLTATSNTLSALDAIGPDRQRFYRVILLP